MKFKVEKIDGGLRFAAPDGWVDLQLLPDNRAYIWFGTHNGTPAEVFGNRIWHLLHDVMPELDLRVVSYDGESDPFLERVLVSAGFSGDGVRRSWHGDSKDGVIYSILAIETRYEVKGPDNGRHGQTGEAAESLDAGSPRAPEPEREPILPESESA